MNAKEKAEELVNKHRMILMHSDTDLGEEIQCSIIAKQCALISVNEVLWAFKQLGKGSRFYDEVKTEIEKL